MNQISLPDYRERIEDAIEDGRYEEAVVHGRHILKTYPRCISAYWMLGRAMLEAGQLDQATHMFQQVVSADPEHMPAWVGMSKVAKRSDALEDAVRYLERAFELATDNRMVAQELRHLYGELTGSEPEQLHLTESALAKLYLRGDLLTRAINELRRLLEDHPERSDLKVALAEALWRDGQRLEACQTCQETLEEQPYTLKPNLILGEIWVSSGRTTEAEPYLKRAEALDPENDMAQKLFGSASPLPPKEPQIEPVAYDVESEKAQIDWTVEFEDALPAQAKEAMAAEIETPSWLHELSTKPEEKGPPAQPEVEAEPEVAPEETLTEEMVEEPVAAEQVAPEEMPEEDALAWLTKLEEEEVAPRTSEGPEEEGREEDRIPAWLAEIGGEPEEEVTLEGEESPKGQEPELAEIPAWLRDLAPPAVEPVETAAPEAPPAASEEEMPERTPTEEALADSVELEAFAEMAELPAWLESEEMPPGDDALAWLAQLAEGDEEEIRTETERQSEARRTEMPKEEGPPTEEEEAEPSLPPALDEVQKEEEALGWVAFAKREEAVLDVEEAVPPEEPEVAPVAEEAGPPMEEPAPAQEEETLPTEEMAEPAPPAPEEALEVEERVTPEEAAPPMEEPAPAPEEEAFPTEEVAEPAPPVPEEALEVGELPMMQEAIPEEDLERFIATQRAYTKKHPHDHEARLELGRVLWQADMRREAVEAYDRLIDRRKLLPDVIADLENYAERWMDASVMQALGDAYMKADRLQDALDTYRQALATV